MLVAFVRLPQPPDLGRVKDVVHGAFAHRRKTLPNSLELAGLAARGPAAAALAALDHGPATRAEELAPDQFVRLTELLA